MKSMKQLNRNMAMQTFAKRVFIPLVLIAPSTAAAAVYIWLNPVSFFEKLVSVPCVVLSWGACFLLMVAIGDEVFG